MKGFLLLLMVIASAIYMDTNSGSFFQAFVLPLTLVIGLAVLFWFKGFVALTILSLGIYYSDLESTLFSEGIFWPLIAVIGGIYFLYWLTQKATEEKVINFRASGGHHNGSDFWDSGGSGGCDGGDGGGE